MKNKRIVSIFLIVFLVASFFVLPASALDYAENEYTTTWESGYYDAATGAKVSTDDNKYIRLSTLLNVSNYDKIRIHTTHTVTWNVHFFDTNGNFISSVYSQNSYSNSENIFNVAGPRMAVSVKSSSYILPEHGSGIKIAGLRYPTIDTTKTGSLTINKYEMQTALDNLSKGTGKKSDSSNVPSGATPFGNVTFKITKVKNISPDYYTSAGTSLPTVVQAQSLAQNSPIVTYTQTTNSNGLATFSNLPLGIYLVQETSSPNQVMTHMDDQVISIPSMDPDGYRWNYDVVLYPKNETRYKSIKVEKRSRLQGSTSTSLITNSSATFNLTKYTNVSFSNGSSVGSFTTGSTGSVTINNLPVKTYYTLFESVAPSGYIRDYSLQFYLDENGNVLSKDKSTVLALASGSNPATISAINSKPTIIKYIDASKAKNPSSEAKTYDSIRRTDDDDNYQYYIVNLKTPNMNSNMNKLQTFALTDSFTAIDGSKKAPEVYKITYGSGATSSLNTILSTDAYTYTCTQDSSDSSKYNTRIDFDTSKIGKNQNYYIYYRTYVKTSTTNKAKIIYSTVTSGTDVTSEIESNVVAHLNGWLKILKQDYENHNLTGAQFQLFATREEALARRNPVYAATNAEGTTLGYTFTTDSQGLAYIYNIDLGSGNSNPQRTYYLVETKAPSRRVGNTEYNYNLLAEPVEVTVSTNGAVNMTNGILVVKDSVKLDFPVTGGQGFVIVFSIGIVFIGLASVLVVKRRKKREVK